MYVIAQNSCDVTARFVCSSPQIDNYEKIYDEVSTFTALNVFDTWFRVDSKPFKQALLNIIKRWSFMFKQHLIDHVTNRSVSLAPYCG